MCGVECCFCLLRIQERLKGEGVDQVVMEEHALDECGPTLTNSKAVHKEPLGLSLNASSLAEVSGRETSQLEGPTPANTYNFKFNQSVLCSSRDIHEVRMCMHSCADEVGCK